MSEDDLISYITDSLGSMHQPFIGVIKARLDSVSYDDLYGLILNEKLVET